MQRAGRCRGTAAFGPHLEFQPCDQRTCETLSVSETPSVAISAPICSPTSGAAANAQPHRTAIARFPHMSDRGPTRIGRRANRVPRRLAGSFRAWNRGEAMGASRFQGGGEARGVPQGSGPAASAVSRSCRPPAAEARLPTPPSATRPVACSPSPRGRHAQRLPLRAMAHAVSTLMRSAVCRTTRRSAVPAAAHPRVCWTNRRSTRGTPGTHAPLHYPPRRGAPRPQPGACLSHAACLVTV